MVTIEQRHGTISEVHDGEVTVRIQQLSACTGCHARKACCSTDCADRYVRVKTSDTSLCVGDNVVIEGEDRIGRLAVFLSFGIPILLLVITLGVSITMLSLGEPISVLVCLGVLTLYFLLLRLMNPRLGRILTFVVRRP